MVNYFILAFVYLHVDEIMYLYLQILFKYPPGKRLPMRMKDLSAFCFPAGVKVSYYPSAMMC